jgi:DNA-binding GntR family transcriptional regulator
MGDLISRGAVIDVLKQNGIIVDNERGNLIIDEINRIPTAYDVDKVVEQLLSESLCARADDEAFIVLDNAIEIVKGGGKGE